MLTRIIGYANKMFGLRKGIGTITESTKKRNNRHYATGVIAGCLMTMALCRFGSFNAVEKQKRKKAWKYLLGHDNQSCSADTLGRRAATIQPESLQALLRSSNRKLRRSKALCPLRKGGYAAIVIDGHEINCSYLRDFGDSPCLERLIKQKDGSARTQYYQRLVCAALVCEGHTQLLDMEMQLPGEGEIATALRLLRRLEPDYSHLFDLILADGLYAQGPFFKAARQMNKHVIAVLKDERRDLTEDARLLLPTVKATSFQRGKKGKISTVAWDVEDLTGWPQAGQDVRVVRTLESKTVTRQAWKKKNYPLQRRKQRQASGCGSRHCRIKHSRRRTLSTSPITGGISRTTALTN